MKTLLFFCAALLSLTVVYNSCSKKKNDQPFFLGRLDQVTVEVAYEAGAEPYTGVNTITGDDLWKLLEDNIKALLAGRTAAAHVTVPKQLTQMQAVAMQNQTAWTTSEISAFAGQFRQGASQAASGDFFIAFLNGHFEADGQVQTNVLGVSLTGTNIIAIFKDVVEASDPLLLTQRYVEQATLIHEMGHALGLVNNGLPLTSAHHDSAHGAHCSESSCVMYYLNEGANDMALFVQHFITSGSTVMFGQTCLDDAVQFSGN